MWALHDGKHMYMVDSMAHAYVEQKKHPDWGIFLLTVPENGFWEIERGPVKIVHKGRLFGDPVNSPFLNGMTKYAGYVGLGAFLSLAVLHADPGYVIMAGLILLMSSILRTGAAKNMLCSIERTERFMRQVREIAGQEGVKEFAVEYFGCTKGVGHGS